MNWNNFQWHSLKTRVTLFTLTICLISLWSLALYSSWMLQEDMELLLGEQQFSTASYIAAKVNEELDNRLRTLERVAGTVSPTMLGNTAALQELMGQQQVLQTLFNGGAFVTRLDGIAIASISPSAERIGVNYMDRDSIAAALHEGKSTIGRPVMGKALPAPVFEMAVPIRDTHGKVVGALAGVTSLGSPSFLDRLTENRYGRTGGYLLIAPQHNLIVTATDKSLIMQPLPAPGMNPMLDRYMHGFDGFGIDVSSRGIEELSAAKHVPVAGWFVSAVLPTAEAFAPIRAMQLRRTDAIFFLTLVVGGLTWWMTWWMLRRQLSPMLDVARTLTTLSETNHPPQPLPITRQDEIGELIGGFNRLMERLNEREAALRESEAKFRSLAESSSDHIMRFDNQCRHTYINPAVLKIAGMTADKIIGKTHSESGFPEHLSRFCEEKIRHVLATAESYQTEFEWNDANGLNFLDWRLIPELGPDGRVHSVWGISRDITERKQMEAARVEALNRLQKIASQVPGIVLQFRLRADGSSCIPYASEAVHKIYRLSPNDVRDDASPAFAIVHPDDLPGLLASIETAAKNLTPWHHEYRLKFAGEPDIWLLGNAIPQQEADGSVLAHGFITDITERKRAEEQFRIAAAAFESQQGMAVTDTDGVILQVNRAFTEITGYPAEEIVGQTPQMLLSRRHNKEFYRTMWEALKSTGGWRGEVWAQRKSGEIYTKLLTISAVKDDDGVVTHYIWAHSDITEHKKAKARIEALAFYDDYR